MTRDWSPPSATPVTPPATPAAPAVKRLYVVIARWTQWHPKNKQDYTLSERHTTELEREIPGLEADLADRYSDRRDFEIDTRVYVTRDGITKEFPYRPEPAVSRAEAKAHAARILDELRNGRNVLSDTDRARIEAETF